MQLASAVEPAMAPSTSSDVAACRALLREGSKSFHAASLLLPSRVRDPAAVVYAFCRVADDAVDEADDPAEGLRAMRRRLDAVRAGSPEERPIDRALSQVVRHHRLPLSPFELLLEGFAWDAEGRRYDTLSELVAYSVRVAATVGVAMSVLMGERRPRVLARACDLGVAMQLTNIARDVGEDVRAGRVYLPQRWLAEVGIDEQALMDDPRFRPEIGLLVRRLLAEARGLYARADEGIAMLPRDCRTAIKAASLVYSDIGRAIVRAGYDSVEQRAYTTKLRKAALLAKATAAALTRTLEPIDDSALPEARPLLDRVAQELS